MSDAVLTVVPVPQPESRHVAVRFENVTIGFEGNTVLDGVSFELSRGESKILLGVSGSGKSTILKLSLGLIKPDSGRILVLGFDITEMSEEQLFNLRRKIGMVFQESALFDSLTVRDNVSYRLREEHDVDDQEIDRRVREALRFVELEHTVDMMPAELSGGMRRRVAIARAIITQPEIVLYDSPTGGLDPVTSTTIIELIVKQRDFYHTSSLMVTHRLQDAFLLATHVFDPKANRMKRVEQGANVDLRTTFLLLRDGKVAFDGMAQELVNSPDPYIQNFIK